MSRTIPRAYVTAAWNKNSIIAQAEAKKYCRELVKEKICQNLFYHMKINFIS